MSHNIKLVQSGKNATVDVPCISESNLLRWFVFLAMPALGMVRLVLQSKALVQVKYAAWP